MTVMDHAVGICVRTPDSDSYFLGMQKQRLFPSGSVTANSTPLPLFDPELAKEKVESRTGAVALVFRWRITGLSPRVASVRFGVALFPVPAHRTEQARFAHSALGESVTRSPTEG